MTKDDNIRLCFSNARLFDNLQEENFVNAIELAQILDVSVDSIRKWRQQQKIPYYKFGRSLRFLVSEVLASLNGGRKNEKSIR